jgi:hypothetical protein
MALPSAGAPDCSSGLSARIFNNLRYDNPWKAGQSGVTVGTLCCPTTPAGIGFRCSAITTGITGGSEPAWPAILTNTVVDGGVTWTAQDVANPSGKAHTPSGQFGYVLTADDLDGFRLLAYDLAKGVCDEVGFDSSAARYHLIASQSIASGSFSIINYTTQDYDTDSAVTIGASWKYTVPAGKGGRFVCSASSSLEPPPASGQQVIGIFKNGSEIARGSHGQGAGVRQGSTVCSTIPAAAGDTIDFRYFQDSGGSQTLEGTLAASWCSIERVFGS